MGMITFSNLGKLQFHKLFDDIPPNSKFTFISMYCPIWGL
jgi:hypothetical protein